MVIYYKTLETQSKIIILLCNLKAIILTIEPQPAGPTFARSARVNGTCTT